MTLEHLLEYEEQQELNEGLRFFKQSNKLNKYADKAESKLTTSMAKAKLTDSQEKQLKEVIQNLRVAAKEFESLEEKFKNKKIEKEKAKKEYEELKRKHAAMLKKLKSDKIKKIAGIVGATAALAGAGFAMYNLGIGVTQTATSASDFFLKRG